MTDTSQEPRNRWKSIFMQTLGWMLLALGAIGGLLPIVQGWIFGVAGLLILSREYQWAHDLLQKVRHRFPRFAQAMDKVSQKAHRLIQTILRHTDGSHAW